MPGRNVAARGHQGIFAALLVLWMQCEEMGLQLQNCDNSFLYFYKNVSNTLTGIDTKGNSVLKMVRNAKN